MQWLDGSIKSQVEETEKLCQQINKAALNDNDLVLLGDLNIDSTRWNDSSYNLKPVAKLVLDTASRSNLVHLPTEYTFSANRHTSEGTKTVFSTIDHCFIQESIKVSKHGVLDNGMSDHRPLFVDIEYNFNNKSKEETYVEKRSYKNFNPHNFCKDLAALPWEILVEAEDVDAMAKIVEDFLTVTLDNHAPVEKFKIKPNYNRHLQPDTKLVMQKRDKTRKEMAQAHGFEKAVLLKQYKSLRNKASRQVKRDTRNGTQQKIMAASNSSSALWRIANGSKHQQSTITLQEEGQEVADNGKVAQILNTHFVTKIANLRNRVNTSIAIDPLSKLREKTNPEDFKHFALKNVSEKDVLTAIKKAKAKASTGFDGFSMKLLKSCKDVLATPLVFLINQSIEEGTFPTRWKSAVVTPLLKKGSSKDKSNYRPVALLSSVSKIVESVVHDQIAHHVERHHLLPSSQHGFRKHRSTTSALAFVCSKWEEWRSQGNYVGALIFDLSAAFDCLDANVLDGKLQWIGFSQKTRQWIKSYLKARKQRVKIGEASSNEEELIVGSPQGAILSPLLFLLYIMDLEMWTEADTTGYADDTGIYCADKDLNVVLNHLETEAKKILSFMASNNLITNESKTELLIIAPTKRKNNNPVSIKVGEATVKESPSIRLLGLVIDNDLQWKTHHTKIKMVISSRIGLIRRLRRKLTSSQLKQLSHSLVFSHIRYALPIFGNPRLLQDDPSHKPSEQLQVELNHLMRLLAGKTLAEHTSIEELISLTGLPTLNQITVESTLLETWKSIHWSLPCKEFFKPTEDRSSRRNKCFSLQIPKFAKKDLFPYKGSKLWNLLPTHIQDEKNFIVAKKEIKNFAKVYSLI